MDFSAPPPERREAAREEGEFLTRSEARVDVLRLLAAHPGADTRFLDDQLDMSHRTILRALNDLVDRGYLLEENHGYKLTEFGSRLEEMISDWATDPAFASGLGQFLSNVPADVLGFDVTALSDAAVTVESEATPFAALDRLLELRREATRIRELTDVIEQRSVKQLADRVRAGEELEVEILLSRSAVDALETTTPLTEAHETVRSSPAVDIYSHPETFKVLVSRFDDTAVLLTEDEDGRRIMLETSDPSVLEWVDEHLGEHLAEATPLHG